MKVVSLTTEAEEAHSVIDAICVDAQVDLKDCYQCGKCAAGCPVASTADMNCRQVIRALQLGLTNEVLAARMPWLCVGCATCVTRCPHNVDIPSLHEALCRYAVAHGQVAVKEGQKFDNIFLDTIQNKGVNDEVMFAAKFNLLTGHLFQDVANSPRMFTRGLLAGDGYAPSDVAEVKRMMQAIRSGTNDTNGTSNISGTNSTSSTSGTNGTPPSQGADASQDTLQTTSQGASRNTSQNAGGEGGAQ